MDFQAQLFFDKKWSRFEDNSFLTNLEFFACIERRPIKYEDREIMKKVRDWMNPKRVWRSGESSAPIPVFTLTDIYRRYEFAERRYKIWKHIIEYPGVTYNSRNNTTTMTTDALIHICEMHSLGEAYVWEPEHRWKEFQIIFDPLGPNKQGMKSLSPCKDYSKMMAELLDDIDKENEFNMDVDESSSDDDDNALQKIPAPDLMSSTKGKGHILYAPVAKPISPALRLEPVDSDKAKASCSSAVKRFLKF